MQLVPLHLAPEVEFLAEVKAIDGVSLVETQTYTLEQM
jgi:hypothetical protein